MATTGHPDCVVTLRAPKSRLVAWVALANRSGGPFLHGAGPSTTWSERSSRVAGGLEAASGAGRGQHAAPGARSARTNGVEAVPWSTQDFARRRRRLCVCGDRLQTRWAERGAGGAASHSFAVVGH